MPYEIRYGNNRNLAIFVFFRYLIVSARNLHILQSVCKYVAYNRSSDNPAELNSLRIIDRCIDDDLRVIRRSKANERNDMLVL
ncbi:hypothetical protein D3C78_1082490 [compost metagenome]